MDFVIYFIRAFAIALIDVLDLAFLLRAILSWIPMDDNWFTELLYRLTEPIIYPFRALLNRLNWFQGFPLDMSFLFALIALSLLRTFLAGF